jgi:hypothetical protein
LAVRIGIGLAGFPFDGPRDFWRWMIEYYEAVIHAERVS